MDELVKSVDDGVLIHLLYVILAEFQERFYRYRAQALAAASAAASASSQPEPSEEREPGHKKKKGKSDQWMVQWANGRRSSSSLS